MLHITLNTGNVTEAIDPPLFTLNEIREGVLEEPYDRYSIIALFVGDTWAYFDLALDDEHISGNMVGWGESEAWEQIISFYLQIYKQLPSVPAAAPLNVWLASVVLPNPKIFESQLAARVEQAIAQALLKRT